MASERVGKSMQDVANELLLQKLQAEARNG